MMEKRKSLCRHFLSIFIVAVLGCCGLVESLGHQAAGASALLMLDQEKSNVIATEEYTERRAMISNRASPLQTRTRRALLTKRRKRKDTITRRYPPSFGLPKNRRSRKPTIKLPKAMKQWHPVQITFRGPQASDQPGSGLNPFLDVRCTATFSRGSTKLTIPCHFAASGGAAYKVGAAAEQGNTWRAYFNPIQAGQWAYSISICIGKRVAINGRRCKPRYSYSGYLPAAKPAPRNSSSRDFKKRGLMTKARNSHFYHFGDDTSDIFLRNGVGSPENLLSYHEFDNTPDPNTRPRARPRKGTKLHKFSKYVAAGKKLNAPFWGPNRDKGAGMFGAVDYLASLGTNLMYMLTFNLGGDGDDVFMYSDPNGVGNRDSGSNKQAAISYKNRLWFDVSKLDQWTNVFEFMQSQGMVLQLLFQEQENDQILDGGKLGTERKVYYRELVSRFAHFNGLIWNHGEENTNTAAQKKSFFNYIASLDPYHHPNVVHTYGGGKHGPYSKLPPLLGFRHMDGPSMQIYDIKDVHRYVSDFYFRSRKAGTPWVLAVDENGHLSLGVPTDNFVSEDEKHHTTVDVLREVLWGSLLAGGDGMSAYFGYSIPNDDLDAETFNPRAKFFTSVSATLAHFATLKPASLSPDLRYSSQGLRVASSAQGTHVVARTSCRGSAKAFEPRASSPSRSKLYVYVYDSVLRKVRECRSLPPGSKPRIDFDALGLDLCSGARVAIVTPRRPRSGSCD